jgi:hypothetical protein
MNQLIFTTGTAGVVFKEGTSVKVASIDVANYERIRIVCLAFTLTGIRFSIGMMSGDEYLGAIDDFLAGSTSSVSRVYEVPGTTLEIWMYGLPAPSVPEYKDNARVSVYGWAR